MNGNGTIIGKHPTPGVTVALYLGNNGPNEGAAVATSQSYADGQFYFSPVPPGAYTVRQTLPAGTVQTVPAGGLGQHVVVSAGALTTVNVTGQPIAFANSTPAVSPVVPPPVNTGPVATPIAQLAWIGYGGNIGASPSSDALGIVALRKFKMSRVRLWQYGQFNTPFPSQLLKDIATYRADGISVVLTYNFQNSTPRCSHPALPIETAYLNQLPPASEIGQLICEWGNEIDSAAYYTGGAIAYAAGFSLFADIMHAKGHLACVGNMTSASDAMNLGNPASNSLYMQLAKAGTFAKADRAGGHYYTQDHASSLRAHQATATWLKTLNPALVYHSTEINLHNAGAAWASELGLLVAGLKAAGLGGDIFPLYPTGTQASAGSLLDASGGVTACGTATLGAE